MAAVKLDTVESRFLGPASGLPELLDEFPNFAHGQSMGNGA